MEDKYTATIQHHTPYAQGLYTLFSTRDEGQSPLNCLMKTTNQKTYQIEWIPVSIIWIGVRATDSGAYYIIKLDDNSNQYGITYFKMPNGQSLKKYLGLTSKIKSNN
jgi:hypothetical protein